MSHECSCKDIIRGIKCDVTNCAYHTTDDHCGAGQIQVGKSNTQCECDSDTKCATFEAKF